MTRRGFTLFEVAISTLIMVTVILGALLLLPAGLRNLQIARYEIVASAAAMTMVDHFHKRSGHVAGGHTTNNTVDRKFGPNLPHKWMNYSYDLLHARGNDLEQVLMNDGILAPVPRAIANRIDSDDDRIRRHLDGGGWLYYLNFQGARGLQNYIDLSRAEMPAELDALVVLVEGDPQQNALPAHPLYNGPAYEYYPFPPHWLRLDASVSSGVDYSKPLRVTFAATPTSTYHSGTQPFSLIDATSAATGVDHRRHARGLYEGRNWAYFSSTSAATSPWNTGYPEFQALAADPTGGWLPVIAVASVGRNPDVTDWSNPVDLSAGRGLFPTYEMRASYRDRAIALWLKLRPAVESSGFPTAGVGGTVDPLLVNAVRACHEYRYGPEALAPFAIVDPTTTTIPGAQWPPHPAQILALSHLAHAAMMVAGMTPPWDRPDASGDWDQSGYQKQGANVYAPRPGRFSPFWIETAEGRLKDAKYVASAVGVGASTVRICALPSTAGAGDVSRRMVFHRGDCVWFAHTVADESAPFHIYQVAADVEIAVGAVGDLPLDQVYEVEADGALRPLGALGLQDPLPLDTLLCRVANPADIAFALQVTRMCQSWAVAWANECPNDFGAPKPMNRPVMSDRPVPLLDLFVDAATGTSAGTAVRNPTATSWLRWVLPPNPHLAQFDRGSAERPNSTSIHQVTHLGPVDRTWEYDGSSGRAMWTYQHTTMRQPGLNEPAAGIDAERYWLPRPFAASDRTRALTFFAVKWKEYEDAETQPCEAFQWHDRDPAFGVQLEGDDYGTLPVRIWHPELFRMWTSAARDTLPTPSDSTTVRLDGTYGADRTTNGKLDVGPVPAGTRMKAVQVARFPFYDPVLRVSQGN